MSENIKDDLNQKPLDVNYWRSFEELYKDESTLKAKQDEFKNGVTDDFDVDKNLSGLSRRKFLALLGASAALAGAGCSDYRDKGEIVSYNKKIDEVLIGQANYYSSTCLGCEDACGILIKTREGRPIKIDGNPDHPVSKGKICSKGQASVLDLYDPSRIQEPLMKRGNGFIKSDWKTVDQEIVKVLNNGGSKEIAIVTHSIVSPTTQKLFEDFKIKYPAAKVYSYELFNQSIKNSTWQKCYGQSTFPLIKWDEANIILSLEGNFLGTEGHKVEQTRMYSSKRDIMESKEFNRLYLVEGNLTVTGMNADYRLRLRPDVQYEFVMSLLNEVVTIKKASSISVDAEAAKVLSAFSLKSFTAKYNLNKETLTHLVSDLIKNKGRAIVYAGSSLSENTQIAVNLLNEVLDNTKLYKTNESSSLAPLSSESEIEQLANSLNNGAVKAVIHFGTNPVFHFSSDLKYSQGLAKTAVITLADTINETTAVSNFVLPINHNFESWGDVKTRTGFYSSVQPVIAPLYNTRQKEAILLNWLSGKPEKYSEKIYLNYLKDNWRNSIHPKLNTPFDFEKYWLGVLHDGVAKANENVSLTFKYITSASALLSDKTESKSGIAVVLQESNSIGDGRFANNGWLQELPHPVSKVTWDNYAAISETTAKRLSVITNDVIEVSVNGKKIELPILVQPGVANDMIAVELGYGRTNSPVVAEQVGFNANKLLGKTSVLTPWVLTGAAITKTNRKHEVVSTQDHQNYDDTLVRDIHLKRSIIKEGTLLEYAKNPKFVQDGKIKLISMYDSFKYPDVKWAMSIDLNKCLGCSECVVACNVENNVPVVGKDQVLLGREMSWLRIDRYYSGTPDNPRVSVQPMLCQHCDNAPCENVCPVVATTHSADGLNQMVYNRCVGTRYCSNNCPYKVRRFNFFDFRDHFRNGYQTEQSFELAMNPEVTVRSRGVMEKCTFCVQRIMDARQEAVKNNTEIKGTDVKTACQVACGTEAIVFGDMNDPESKLSKYRNHELGYVVLEELNILPNVTYIAKLRNTFTEEL